LPYNANVTAVAFFHFSMCLKCCPKEHTTICGTFRENCQKKLQQHSWVQTNKMQKNFSRNIRFDSKGYSMPQSKPKGLG